MPSIRFAAAVLPLIVSSMFASPGSSEIKKLVHGRIILSDSAVPPANDDPRWEPVELPDEWAVRRPDAVGGAWYRFSTPPDSRESTEALALYLPEFNVNAGVWVNGEPIGECGSLSDPIAYCWNRPLLLNLPASLLSESENLIDIRLVTYQPFGGLSPILLAPASELLPRFRRQLLLQVGVPQIFTVLAAVVIVFMVMLAVGTGESLYAYFGAIAFAFSIAMLNNWVREPWLPKPAWDWMVHHAFDWIGPLCVLFTHRFTGLERPWIDRIALGFPVVAGVITFLALGDRVTFHETTSVMHAGTLLIGAYAQIALLTFYPRLTVLQRIFFVIGGGGALVIGAHDIAIQFGWLGREAPHLFAFAAPILTLSFAVMLTSRFLGTFQVARRLNVKFEERVREKQAEIEASSLRIHQVERERAVAEERNRIFREVHDGVGGSLVAALALVETRRVSPDELARSIRAAIDDMRLVIDSLDPELGDLAALLGVLRRRVEPLLLAQRMRFDWRVTDLPPLEQLGPKELLHVLRICQEAITNVIKHSGARVLIVATRTEGSAGNVRVVVEICDDGCGIRDRSGGHGLRNMAERASAIGAELTVFDESPGTCVRLVIPYIGDAGSN